MVLDNHVRRRSARLHRDAERQRGQRRHAHHSRPAGEQPRQTAHHDQPDARGRQRQRTAVAQRPIRGEFQISPTSSTGVTISAPSIAHARPRTVRPSTAPAASAAATTIPAIRTPSENADVSLIGRPDPGVTRRRMSTMLCVICATSRSRFARLSPLRQPDADLDRPCRAAWRQHRERLARQLALGLGLRALAVRDVLAEGGEQLRVRPCRAAWPPPRGGRSPVQRAVRAGQSRATSSASASRAAAASPVRGSGDRLRVRAPNGSVGVGWVGRASVRPVVGDPAAHAAAHRLGAEARHAPAGLDVAAQATGERARDPAQRAGEEHAGRLAGLAGAGERDVEVLVRSYRIRARSRKMSSGAVSAATRPAAALPANTRGHRTGPPVLSSVFGHAVGGRRRPCRRRAT